MKAVEERVADESVLRMIRACLAAGYMEQWQYHKTYSGTPQGGVLSPLLCNIFLHQLDGHLMSAMFRGWCNYYRYATAPQATFNDLSRYTWWPYAHYVARKHRLSIAQMLKQEQQAGRLREVKKNGRKRSTFRVLVTGKAITLDLFPPRTGQIRALASTGQWTVDLKPVIPTNWQSGRSLATRTAALERAKGLCERCGEKPVAHVHHTVPLRGKTFLARVTSDSAQRYTAIALCQECHLEAHGGSYAPRKRKGQVG